MECSQVISSNVGQSNDKKKSSNQVRRIVIRIPEETSELGIELADGSNAASPLRYSGCFIVKIKEESPAGYELFDF